MLGSPQDIKVCYCDCHQSWNSIHPPVCVCSCRYHGVGRIAFSARESILKQINEKALSADVNPVPKSPERSPHKCPLCGHIAADVQLKIDCRACGGKGIVWG